MMIDRRALSDGPAKSCVFCGKSRKIGVRGGGKFFACPSCLGSPGARPIKFAKDEEPLPSIVGFTQCMAEALGV